MDCIQPKHLDSIPPLVQDRIYGQFYIKIGNLRLKGNEDYIDNHEITKIAFRVKFLGDYSIGIFMKYYSLVQRI